MSYNTIEFSIDDGVAELVLNRPERLNSFTTEMHREVAAALAEIKKSDARCLLLRANGRGFCAGQDLADPSVNPESPTADIGAALDDYYNPLINTLTKLEMPVICAVNGFWWNMDVTAISGALPGNGAEFVGR